MMRLKIYPIVTISAALIGGLVATSTYAESSTMPQSVSVGFVDTNHNGRISRAEYVAFARKEFASLAECEQEQAARDGTTQSSEHLWEYQRHPQRIYRNY